MLGLPGMGAKGDKAEYIDAVSTRSGVCTDILRCKEKDILISEMFPIALFSYSSSNVIDRS